MKLAEQYLEISEGNPIYQKMKASPIKVKIKKNVKEVVFKLVSAMLDNKSQISFKLKDGEFKINTHGQAFSNFQIKSQEKNDLEWLADEGKWQEVVDAINSGTVKVHEIKQR